MKYTFALALFAVLTIGFASCSQETTSNDMTQLPASVQKTVNDNFDAKVISVTTESAAIGVDEYEIYLNDGSKVTFAGEEWDEVEVPVGKAVPTYFIPEGVSAYVTENVPGQTIIKIERDKKGYDVDLSNGVELQFDVNGNFVKVD